MIKVRQIKIDVLKDSKEARLKALTKKMKLNANQILDVKINRQSIDARDKNQIFYVYELLVTIKGEDQYLKNNKNPDILMHHNEKFKLICDGTEEIKSNIAIIGSGPAGLFCAYVLAENGYKPIVIERGKKVEERTKDVEEFWKTGILNPESNVQFGEGGAGTFSDGKLNTLIKDPLHLGKKVFDTFVKHGADPEILYSYKPHIGTDVLAKVVASMREEIIKNGGEFYFESMLTNVNIREGKVRSIEINHKDLIFVDALVLAIGHSARDTFLMLNSNGIRMENKPFAVGVRVEHDQAMIDEAQYGEKYAQVLSKAPYKLTYQTKKGRGVYSFCMCPGGYVVNASTNPGELAINGMSYHDRGSRKANSAIIVSIDERDYGSKLFDGMRYQQKLERLAYNLGMGKIPTSTLRDYYDGVPNEVNVDPEIKGKYTICDINKIFEDKINESLKEAFHEFGKKIKGFDNPDTILHAVESRTSSPVRIIRYDNMEANIEGIYPCGEGAGYAGGITSAAIDGIMIASAIAHKFKHKKI